jgi:integrase
MGLYRRKDSQDWWMSFTANDKHYRRSTETPDKKLAEKIYAKVQTLIAEGKWFEIDEAKKHTFDEMMERFMREHAPTKEPSMQKSYRVSLAHLREFFSGMTLDKIDTDAVLRYGAYRRSQNNSKPGTRNREVAMLSKAFNLARLWKWLKENPCQLVKREKEDNEIGRCLTDEEEQRLLRACRNYLRGQLAEMVIIALNTGMREGEILKLRWDQIDMKGKVINTINEKTNKPKTVSMNETVYNLLNEKSKVRSMSGYVFTTGNDKMIHVRNMLRAWYKALKEAKIEGGLRYHDLRHTVGTRLIIEGQDIYAVASVLDHSQLSTAKRYAKHNVESKRKILNVLDKKNGFHDSFTLAPDRKNQIGVTP